MDARVVSHCTSTSSHISLLTGMVVGNATIKQLVVYPVKSCMGIDLPSATLTPLGEQRLQLMPACHCMMYCHVQALRGVP